MVIAPDCIISCEWRVARVGRGSWPGAGSAHDTAPATAHSIRVRGTRPLVRAPRSRCSELARAQPLGMARCNILPRRGTIDVASASLRRTARGRQLAAFDRALQRRNKVPVPSRLTPIPSVILAQINATVGRRVEVASARGLPDCREQLGATRNLAGSRGRLGARVGIERDGVMRWREHQPDRGAAESPYCAG